MSTAEFDLIVIGAGINGAGIARDAAMRGLRVLLLDKGDIGGGTSSWSTRLIHGGLRYLEHGEFGLVRESLRERACLMDVAPHLVRALPLLVPLYKGARRGVWTIRAGMMAYDALSFDKTLPRHRMLSAGETLERAPGLSSAGLRGAAVYFDAQVEYAERLVLENVLSAVEHHATVMTYARVDKLIVENGSVRGVEFSRQGRLVHSPMSKVQCPDSEGQQPDCDAQRPAPKAQDGMSRGEEGGLAPALTDTGGSSPTVRKGANNERHYARAPVVINAAGPWVDQVLTGGDSASPRLIGGTKGSHLVVASFAGAPDTAVYVEAETDGRPFFIIPWDGKYLIGTTDIRYDGDLDRVHIDDEEIDYLLRETNRVIPNAKLTREKILYIYSGVRPLPFTGDRDEQSITRRHFIRSDPKIANLFSIVGGKLTTYRSLAEEAVDLVLKRFDGTSRECTTATMPLPGAECPDFDAFRRQFMQHSGLPDASSDRLLRIYGTRSSLILQQLSSNPSLAEVFDAETGAMAVEIVHAFKHELAQTLGDCLLRRTMVGLNSSSGLDALEAAARIAQPYLGWSDSHTAEEIDAYRREVSGRFRG
jgi:glycerol-3-phosphate dehydrogenase